MSRFRRNRREDRASPPRTSTPQWAPTLALPAGDPGAPNGPRPGQVGDFTRRTSATANELAPGMATGAARLVGEAVAAGAELREAARDLDLAKHFEDGLVSLGRQADSGRVVLLFANLDRLPT